MWCCTPVVPAAWEVQAGRLLDTGVLCQAGHHCRSQKPDNLKELTLKPALSSLHSGPNSDLCILFFLTTKDECFQGTFHFKYGKNFS